MSLGDTFETQRALKRGFDISKAWKWAFRDMGSRQDGRKKSRILKPDSFPGRKLREASMSENWAVVSFWVKLWAFCWLLAAQLAGVMMGRLLRRFQSNLS